MRKSTITKEELQLMELHNRYLSDRIIASHRAAIHGLYQIAVPTVILKDKIFTLHYDSNTLYEVDRINEIIIHYIRENYEELIIRK